MRTIVFLLTLVFIFIIPWEGIIEFPGLGTMAKLIGLALAAIWVATVIVTNRIRKPSPFHIMVCLFVLWNAVSVFWSADVDKTVDHVLTWAQLLGLVFILWDFFTTRTTMLAGLQAYVLGAYVAIGSALANFFAGNAAYTYNQRFSSSEQTNPDGFGFILVLGIPVAWYLASSMESYKVGGMLKIINYSYIPVAFFGLALSGTRTAAIATIPALAFGIASLTRLRLRTRIVIFLLLSLAIFLLLPTVQQMKSFQRLGTTAAEITEGDLNSRTFLWREGLVSFEENPLLGIGSNMYRSVNSLGKLAHNSFLSVLVELGLIGFVLFGIIVAIVFVQAWNQPKWEAAFWLTVLAVWVIGASSLTYEHRKATWLFLSMIIVSAALTRHRTEKAAPLVQHDEPGIQAIPSYNRPRTQRIS